MSRGVVFGNVAITRPKDPPVDAEYAEFGLAKLA